MTDEERARAAEAEVKQLRVRVQTLTAALARADAATKAALTARDVALRLDADPWRLRRPALRVAQP
jgi:hypothetical protein